MKKKKVNIIVAMTVFALSLSACAKDNNANIVPNETASGTAGSSTAGESNEITKLKVYLKYFDDDTKKPYDYAVAELKKAMPNVELDLDPWQQDNFQKLKTYAATGNMPDIYDADYGLIKAFAESKNIEILDNAQATKDLLADFNPGYEKSLTAADGHTYAYSATGTGFQILYYNKKLFAEAGVNAPIKTYDEWIAAIKKFKDKGIAPMAIFAKEKWITNSFYKGLVTREQPEGYFPLEQKGLFQLPDPYKLASKQFEELKQAGLFDPNATNTNYDQASSLFYTGKAAMFVNGQWEIYAATENLGDDVDWMYWPAKDEETYENMKFSLNGAPAPGGFAVAPTSKHKELAIEVAAFLARKYAEYQYLQKANPIVSLKIDQPISITPPPMMQRIIDEVLPNIKGYAKFNESTELNNALDDNTQNLVVKGFGNKQFDENMERILKKINK
ncbi:ABC transporter substrate-binding protein [Cohnella mopanensis]|uniref:ABC transporter substrate-binding protein n=1 Tax=Cohnella mopanensis TaxID=2911966 RepID=UPI001EF996C7|nr:extracellular solute-binding protein [Cohnella mopanensis]